MHRRTALTVALLAALPVVLGTAACGGEETGPTRAAATASPAPRETPFAELSPKEITAAAKEAMAAARTVRMRGGFELEPGRPAELDLTLVDGAGGSGTVQEGSAKVRLVSTSKAFYLKANRAFWKENAPGTEALLADAWLKGDPDQAEFKEFAELSDISTVTEDLLDFGALLERRPPTEVDGTPVAVLGLDYGRKSVTYYVAATGPAYPLRVVMDDGKETQDVRLSGWSTTAEPAKKPSGTVIDLQKLQSGG